MPAVSWFAGWGRGSLLRARSVTIAAAAVAIGLLAVYLAWTAEGQVQQWATRLLAEHAIRRLEARLLAGVGPADLEAPPAGQPNALAQRLDILLDDARADGERSLVQATIYAADGTILFSGQPD